MTNAIGNYADVSRREPYVHQSARGIQAQGAHRRNVIGFFRSVALFVRPSLARRGVRAC